MTVNLTKADYLFSRLMLALIAVGSFAQVGWLLWRWATNRSLVWVTAIPNGVVAPVISSTADAEITWGTDTTRWEFLSPTTMQWIGAMVPSILTGLVVTWLCWLAWRLIATIQSGRAYAPGAHRICFQAGIALLAYTVSDVIGRLVSLMLITPAPLTEPVMPALVISAPPFIPLALSGVAWIIAHAWREGERLNADAEATI